MSLEIINHDHNNLSVTAANFTEQRLKKTRIYTYMYIYTIQMYVFNISMSLIF